RRGPRSGPAPVAGGTPRGTLAAGPRRPRLRVREGVVQVVLAGAQPLAHRAVGLPRPPPRARRARPAGGRAGPARSGSSPGLVGPFLCASGGRRSFYAGARTTRAGTPTATDRGGTSSVGRNWPPRCSHADSDPWKNHDVLPKPGAIPDTVAGGPRGHAAVGA